MKDDSHGHSGGSKPQHGALVPAPQVGPISEGYAPAATANLITNVVFTPATGGGLNIQPNSSAPPPPAQSESKPAE